MKNERLATQAAAAPPLPFLCVAKATSLLPSSMPRTRGRRDGREACRCESYIHIRRVSSNPFKSESRNWARIELQSKSCTQTNEWPACVAAHRSHLILRTSLPISSSPPPPALRLRASPTLSLRSQGYFTFTFFDAEDARTQGRQRGLSLRKLHPHTKS